MSSVKSCSPALKEPWILFINIKTSLRHKIQRYQVNSEKHTEKQSCKGTLWWHEYHRVYAVILDTVVTWVPQSLRSHTGEAFGTLTFPFWCALVLQPPGEIECSFWTNRWSPGVQTWSKWRVIPDRSLSGLSFTGAETGEPAIPGAWTGTTRVSPLVYLGVTGLTAPIRSFQSRHTLNQTVLFL